MAKRDEVVYSNVGSVKNSYSFQGGQGERKSTGSDQSEQQMENNKGNTDSEMLYYGPFYPRGSNIRRDELYYPEYPTYYEGYPGGTIHIE